MNEIDLPAYTRKYGGQDLLSGGGKFDAKFSSKKNASLALNEIKKTLATTLPMLEFQVSAIVTASSFMDAKDRLTADLAKNKMHFRGYGVSFNPHFSECSECGEYPATSGLEIKGNKVCQTCFIAYENSRNIAGIGETEGLTSIQKILKSYIERDPNALDQRQVPLDFDNIFSSDHADKKGKRMAVWFSDINNMGQKIPLWLYQTDDEIIKIFETVREKYITTISNALKKTFNSKEGNYYPFRIIITGGDDLCIVMDERYILDFALQYSKEVEAVSSNVNVFNIENLQQIENQRAAEFKYEPKIMQPYNFGSAFVITSIHTPFRRIHEIGEGLLKEAKSKSARLCNSIHWKVLAEDEEPASDRVVKFEKPLFIDTSSGQKSEIQDYLTLTQYNLLRSRYSRISHSHIQQIVSLMIRYNNNSLEVERALKILDSTEKEKSFSGLLVDDSFRKDGKFDCSRVATLFELMSIG
jgi:CRISPR/Cas system-associated protein Cas10 (large subunit of type III CRISPR-Cas system)